MLGDIWRDMVVDVAASTWVVAGLLLGMCVLLRVLTHVTVVQRGLVARSSAAAGLGLPHSLEPVVRAAQVRRVRGLSGGGFLGVLVSVVFVYLIGADRSGPATLFLLGGFAIGGALGSAIAAVSGEVHRTADGERVAHGRRACLADYVPLWERVGARIAVLLSLTIVGVQVALPAFGGLPLTVFPESFSVAVVVSGLAIAALAVFEIGGPLIVARPQTTGSELELAWDDALRSAAILALVAAAFLLGCFGSFLGIQEIAMAVRGAGGGLASAVAFNVFGVVVLGGGVMTYIRTSRGRYSLRTLHADEDAGARLAGPK